MANFEGNSPRYVWGVRRETPSKRQALYFFRSSRNKKAARDTNQEND